MAGADSHPLSLPSSAASGAGTRGWAPAAPAERRSWSRVCASRGGGGARLRGPSCSTTADDEQPPARLLRQEEAETRAWEGVKG